MMNNKMIEYKESIFKRIINFFKKLLSKDHINNQIEQKKNTSTDKINNDNSLQIKKDEFKNSVMIKEDPERKRLLSLREQWENGKIEEEDLCTADIDAIAEIYNEETEQYKQQLEELEKEKEMKKKEIAKLLKKLKQSA